MSTILCRICWMEKYNGLGDLQCVHMNWNENYGGEMWNFSPCQDGIVRGYVMLKAKDKYGNYPGTININKLGASKNDKFIDDINIIFFAMSPKDKTNYIVGWYEHAKVYRNWRQFPVENSIPWEERSYSFEADNRNAYLISEGKRKIRIISAKTKGANMRGGAFPGQSDVFFGTSNEVYTYELSKKIALLKIEKDIEEIENLNETTETEKQRLISTRLGQGWYREQLISYWRGCSVTKCNEISVLRASHIKPWHVSSNEERLDVFNGLLLTPNVDILFDKGFISFDNDGKIIISEQISSDNISKLGINSHMEISICDSHIKFLEWHREKIFKT